MPLSPSDPNESVAAKRLAAQFRADGWQVRIEPQLDSFRPDLAAEKGAWRYAVELKSVGEGRPDRVLAFLSQAILQARRHAQDSAMHPLAVIHVGHASPSLHDKLEQFHRDYAPDMAIGLMSDDGGSRFLGPGLEGLNVERVSPHASRARRAPPRKASDLFSDLNQWMLKVLLAPELPERLLHAPRRDCRSASELAEAAEVSAMSASRFVRRLQEDGFLDDSGSALRVVRRRELYRRWQSAALRSSPELRMCFVVPGSSARQLHKLVAKLEGCLGLYAAADALRLGHVSGVPPQVLVRRLAPPRGSDWPGLVPARPGEPPELILKQASAPESLFRAAVRVDDLQVADVLQIWLDASADPSRGAEQAEFLQQGVLSGVLKDAE